MSKILTQLVPITFGYLEDGTIISKEIDAINEFICHGHKNNYYMEIDSVELDSTKDVHIGVVKVSMRVYEELGHINSLSLLIRGLIEGVIKFDNNGKLVKAEEVEDE